LAGHALPREFAASGPAKRTAIARSFFWVWARIYVARQPAATRAFFPASPALKTPSSHPPAFIGNRRKQLRQIQVLAGGCKLARKNLLLGHATADEQPVNNDILEKPFSEKKPGPPSARVLNAN
jgi:hypothetical protein